MCVPATARYAHSFCLSLYVIATLHYRIQDAAILKALDEMYATVSSLGPQHEQDEEKEKVSNTMCNNDKNLLFVWFVRCCSSYS
jgi:hypothetical protein